MDNIEKVDFDLTQVWKETPILRLAVFLLVLDYIWLGYLGKGMYQSRMSAMGNSEEFQMRWWSVVMAYGCMLWSFWKWVIPQLSKDMKWSEVAELGRNYAILSYGVFNATNHAVFEQWDWMVALSDMMWGIIVSTLSLWLTIQTGDVGY